MFATTLVVMKLVRAELRVALVAVALIGAPVWAALAEDDKKDSGGSLGDLLNKVKDLKVPDSVATLPGQLTELKDAYLKTAQTVEDLRVEVDRLSEEVSALKSDNAELRLALEDKRVRDDLTQAAEVTTDELVEAYAGDAAAADVAWKGRYVKISGPIDHFESGTQEFYIYLRASQPGKLVRCAVKRGASFDVDVVPSQGRVVSREDRSTLLTVGQPVTVTGTCTGSELNVIIENCSIDGLTVKREAVKR